MKGQQITVVLDDDLLYRCKKDAEEYNISFAAYIRLVLKERHGYVKLTKSPPKLTQLPMNAGGASYAGGARD